jgi:hypothetical protein
METQGARTRASRALGLGRTLAKDIGAAEAVMLAFRLARRQPLIALGAIGVAAWYRHRQKRAAAAGG